MQNTLSVISLSAIRNNARLVRDIIGKRFLFAVVKADGYGHGGEKVALAIHDIVDGFCVAICDEGVRLRVSGVNKPVLVLTPPLDEEDAKIMRFYSLTPTVAGIESAKLLKGEDCHLAVNTGMNRYGVYGGELDKVLSVLPKNSIKGAYSHLYAADNTAICEEQYRAFATAEELIKSHSPNSFSHIAASGGILRGGKYLKQGVRCGLMLYGYAPGGFNCSGLIKALRVYARLSQQTKPFGGGVGYNVADREYEKLYTYRLGYADGFFRGVPLGEKTLCMDAFIGDRREDLFPVMTDAEAYARRAGTISYEVLCSVTKRSRKIYEE